jgi:OOP family OmpA-OmpF porin
MKHILIFSILISILNASEEFPFIEPVSVEVSPVLQALNVDASDSDYDNENDNDGDGVLNREDKCSNTKSGEAVDKYGCLLQADADKDGVPDSADKCPNTVNEMSVNENGCPVDSDGDGVADFEDRCVDTSKDFIVDGYGCPQTTTLKVNFKAGQYKVTNLLVTQLKDFAYFLKENKGYQVIIYGYTDSSGDAKANKTLSQNRANSIKEVLIRYGISITRLTAIGKGELDPIATNKTKEGRSTNRRIEIELMK